MKEPRKKLVLVEWEDASHNNGYWGDEVKADTPLFVCYTVGYLMSRGKKKIDLAVEGFDDGAFRHINTIPRKMIKSIHTLRKQE